VEPLTLILGALAAGAVAGVQESAGQAVKDAYAALKNLLRRRLSGNEAGEVALTRYEQQPDTWEQPLRSELSASGADQDDEVVAAAQVLLDLVRADPVGAKIFQNQFHGQVQGFVQGDYNRVTMKFSNDDRGA
jgi:hypothetical protein